MNKKIQEQFAVAIILLIGYAPPALAYLDPASGSMLFAAILGALATVIFLVKKTYYRAVSFIFRLFGKEVHAHTQYDMVFYSEGKQYWNTFKPVVEALENRGIKILYMSSDETDQGLSYDSSQVDTRYINRGNRAYTTLNLLETDICVLTTPGLDVLQIRRSKGVKHYSHIVHAPTTGTYKLYSFDYFDSVLCSGQHQIDAITELENKRSTTPKQLLKTGCVYMDVLSQKLENFQFQTENTPKNDPTTNGKPTILLAPSWGSNALLSRFGSSLVKMLLDNNFNVVIRPHPQSYVSEKEMLEQIEDELKNYSDIQWDRAADSFDALSKADIMISDLSGVIFDCAFVFEKPVITVKFDLDLRGLEANHLENGLWEQGMLNKVGRLIEPDEITNLHQIVKELLMDDSYTEKLKDLRSQHLYNYKAAGKTAANQLMAILESVKV